MFRLRRLGSLPLLSSLVPQVQALGRRNFWEKGFKGDLE